MINVFASVKNCAAPIGNSGDLFGYFIAESILGGNECQRLDASQKDLIDSKTACIVGSLLQYLPPNRGAHIFGPGFISQDSSTASLRGNNVISVRGYLSWEKAFRAGVNPSISSDPGLLLRKLYKNRQDDSGDAFRIPAQPLGIVLHGVDKKFFLNSYPHLAGFVVDNYAPMNEYIYGLSRCPVLVTSSLHGAVFGHALGLKVGVISVSGMVTGGAFKYRDYYSSLGIDASPVSVDTIGSSVEHFIDFALSYPQPSSAVVDCVTEKCNADLVALLRELSR